MSSLASTEPLAEKSINTSVSPMPSTEAAVDNKPKSLEYHRQMLQNKLSENNSQKAYTSPSDTIMSPCTRKLSDYKQKQYSKAKPKSLFAAKIGASKATSDSLKDTTTTGLNP